MSGAGFSGSKVEHVIACPGSVALDHEADPGNPAADAGTARHALAAAYVRGGAEPAADSPHLAWFRGAREALDALREAVVPWVPEVAYALDPVWRAARVLGIDLGRNYGDLDPTEIPATADYVLRDPVSGALDVLDLKTGRGAVTPPRRNGQLLTLAAAAVLSGARQPSAVRVGLLLAPEGAEPEWLFEAVSLAELDSHVSALAEVITLASEARAEREAGREVPHLRPGAHCRYCRAACPARSRLVASAVEVPATPAAPTFRDRWVEALKAGQAGEVRRAQAVLKHEVDAMEAALRDAARAGPIDIGDGKRLAWRSTTREVIDPERAWVALGERYGAEVARAAMSMETSKAGVERAMREHVRARKEAGDKVTLKAAVGEAIGALRSAGAVTEKTSEVFEEQHE